MRNTGEDYFTRRAIGAIPGLLLALLVIFFKSAHNRVEQIYQETLDIRYFLEDTVMRMLEETFIGVVFSIAVVMIMVHFWKSESRKKYLKLFITAYVVLLLVVLSGLSVRKNTWYEVNHVRMRNAQVVFCSVKDMIQDEYVTFTNEPCEYQNQMVERAFGEEEYYPYLWLEKQQAMIPIPTEYSSIINGIIIESEGVCDITCYQNSYMITEINGVKLTNLK